MNGTPTISTTTLPNATQGAAYNQTLAGTGGTTPYTWSETGALPSGLSLNASTGAITGTVAGNASAKTYSITWKLTDANGVAVTKTISIRVVT